MALRAAFEKETYGLVSDPLTGSIVSGPNEAFLTASAYIQEVIHASPRTSSTCVGNGEKQH